MDALIPIVGEKGDTMNRMLLALVLVLFTALPCLAIVVTLFVDADTFVQRAKEIVIAKCLGPVPEGLTYPDGLYPVKVEIVYVVKGARKVGKATIATIYRMEAGKLYLLTSLGGSAFGTDFLAVPELSVVELPPRFSLDGLKGKKVIDQARAVFAARREENQRLQRALEEEKKLLDKAVGK
jgi:hypothetical protein